MKTLYARVVVFRVYKATGLVVALFPHELVDDVSYCLSVNAEGKYVALSYERTMRATRVATPQEYEGIKVLLESAGYTLDIRERKGMG